jgi:hypothetical protein
MVTYDEINKMFGGFGMVDLTVRTPWHGARATVNVPAEFTMTIELMPHGRNGDENPHINDPYGLRNAMYDMAEQAINLVEKHYKLSDAPQVEIGGLFRWVHWPTESYIMTTGRVIIEFVEKDA